MNTYEFEIISYPPIEGSKRIQVITANSLPEASQKIWDYWNTKGVTFLIRYRGIHPVPSVDLEADLFSLEGYREFYDGDE